MKDSTSAQNRRPYSSTAGGTQEGSEKVALQLRYEALGLARQIGRAAFSRKKRTAGPRASRQEVAQQVQRAQNKPVGSGRTEQENRWGRDGRVPRLGREASGPG